MVMNSVTTFDDRDEAEHAAAALGAAGHAVTLDLVFTSGGRFEQARIHHLLTCVCCEKERRREVTQ
jgi:hypothetical protein